MTQHANLFILLSFTIYGFPSASLADLLATLPEELETNPDGLPLIDEPDSTTPSEEVIDEEPVIELNCPEGSALQCENTVLSQLNSSSICECRDVETDNQCEYFAIGKIKALTGHDTQRKMWHGQSMVTWKPQTNAENAPQEFNYQTLSCLEEIATRCINKTLKKTRDHVGSFSRCGGASHLKKIWPDDSCGKDDCVVKNMVEQFQLGKFNQKSGFAKGYRADSVALDADCNRVEVKKGKAGQEIRDQLCGSVDFTYILTPISLILDPPIDNVSNISLVKFPLDPHREALWHPWKASARMPLLVYDPERSGKIDDGSKLFGNWTFGGKHHSSISSNNQQMTNAHSSAWQNGYEALQTLDLNADDKLEGNELSSLSLWFDNNQDGISQTGEVRTLADSSIITIYTKADPAELNAGEKSQDLYATLGYQRMINGTLVRGASVDWLSDGSKSKVEAVNKLQLYSVMNNFLSSN